MTEEQMNRAVAEVLGWNEHHFTWNYGGEPDGKEMDCFVYYPGEKVKEGMRPSPHITRNPTDDEFQYCRDKNSHAALFEYLAAEKLDAEFVMYLRQHTDKIGKEQQAATDLIYDFHFVTAAAPLIVEAFLKAVGKWDNEGELRL